jgi:predicted nuclease of predicted toxin-antitoxin system
MFENIRFHLDENVPFAIAQGLRTRGIDCSTTQDANLTQANDFKQLKYATDNKRVLVTHDSDFLRIHKNRITHTGITYCPQGSRTIGQIIKSLLLIYELLDQKEMIGAIEYL